MRDVREVAEPQRDRPVRVRGSAAAGRDRESQQGARSQPKKGDSPHPYDSYHFDPPEVYLAACPFRERNCRQSGHEEAGLIRSTEGSPAGGDIPPAGAGLLDDEVHLWTVDLAGPAPPMGELERMLQPDERRRARERSAMPRRQFVVSRSALRTVLATYVAAAPADLRFVAAQNGKPRIAEAEVEFNLSHSHEIAVIAVARHAVGVDVERVRADVPVGRLANRLFTQAEAAMFMALPERDRREELFRCWTRKEAYAKATGVGRPLGLRSFEVPVASQLPTHHLAGGWFLADLVVAAGYAGAVVVKGGRHRIIPQRLAPA